MSDLKEKICLLCHNKIVGNIDEMIELGEKLGQILYGQKVVIALSGDLGTGKTVLTSGIARGLSIDAKIKSPTFVLMREYSYDAGKMVHSDIYRMENVEDDFGLQDYFGNLLVIIEWAEKMKKLLPSDTIWIKISYLKDSEGRLVECI